LLLAAFLAAVDAVAHRTSAPPPPLPELAAVPPETVHTVELRRLEDHVRLVRDGSAWRMAAPREQPADTRGVEALLAGFGAPIRFDARVDVKPEEARPYGLTPEDAVVVSLGAADGRELLRLYVGNNLGDGTFVRLKEDDAIYRARIGGRSRFDRPVGAWKDRRVLPYDRPPRSLVVETDAMRLELSRSATAWSSPTLDVDTPLVERLAMALGAFESGEELRPDDPRAQGARLVDVILRHQDGRESTLHFRRSGAATSVQVEGSTELHLVGSVLPDLLAAPLASWRNHALLQGKVDAVARHVLDEGGTEVVLERVGDAWQVTRPPNVSVDPAVAARVAEALPQLRVEQWIEADPAAAGYPSEVRVRVERRDGTVDIIEIGAFGPVLTGDRPTRYVRTAANPGALGVITAKGWQTVRSAFGR
jgi:hypothetical protein